MKSIRTFSPLTMEFVTKNCGEGLMVHQDIFWQHCFLYSCEKDFFFFFFFLVLSQLGKEGHFYLEAIQKILFQTSCLHAGLLIVELVSSS